MQMERGPNSKLQSSKAQSPMSAYRIETANQQNVAPVNESRLREAVRQILEDEQVSRAHGKRRRVLLVRGFDAVSRHWAFWFRIWTVSHFRLCRSLRGVFDAAMVNGDERFD